LGAVAIVFFPDDGFGWSLMGAGLVESLLALVCLADVPVFLGGFPCAFGFALTARFDEADADLAGFFVLLGAFFLAAAFLADMVLASKTAQTEPAIIQRHRGSGRG
jgi:hypothetical protein